jgi:hypothetical protein
LSTIWDDNVTSACLNTRGWVLQETHPSPHVVHFAKDQVFWECRHQRACESYPEGMRYTIDDRAPRPNDAYIKDMVPGFNLGQHPLGFVEPRPRVYRKLVIERYSTCNLTFQTDKLIALSGIAQHLDCVCQQDYYAGMWKDHLPHGLIWSAAYGGPSRGIDAGVAPSWSWASVGSPVHYHTGSALRCTDD